MLSLADCIECGCYASGGNFSGFKSIPNNWNQGFPIAEISADGTFDIYLQEGARGMVSRDTITAQLVYEIQVNNRRLGIYLDHRLQNRT